MFEDEGFACRGGKSNSPTIMFARILMACNHFARASRLFVKQTHQVIVVEVDAGLGLL